MTGFVRALARLLAVQGTWNYERMQGISMGYAAEPLLEALKRDDPVRHHEAVARSAEFFNANPHLAGLALGATVRAEYDAVSGVQIARLRTALCSPLGALGDQLFWAGLVPGFVATAVAVAVLGAGGWAIAGLLILYNAVRLWTSVWALRTGVQAGMRVGSAISASWMPRTAALVGPVAGFAVGAAAPIAATWYFRGLGGEASVLAAAVAVAGIIAIRFLGPAFTTVRFAFGVIGLTLVIQWLRR